MTLDHNQLITLAHKTSAAAEDHDYVRLEANATRLFEALADHLSAEYPELLHVAPSQLQMITRGQRRIIDDLVELAISATQDPDQCRCEHLAANLVEELTLQADAERRYLTASRLMRNSTDTWPANPSGTVSAGDLSDCTDVGPRALPLKYRSLENACVETEGRDWDGPSDSLPGWSADR